MLSVKVVCRGGVVVELSRRRRRRFSFSAEIWSLGPELEDDFDFEEDALLLPLLLCGFFLGAIFSLLWEFWVWVFSAECRERETMGGYLST